VGTHLRAEGRHLSHSVNCHPTQVNAPRLTSARKAGTRFTYLEEMEGWVDLGGWLHTEMIYLSADGHLTPSINRARRTRCRVTTLIKTNALLPSRATTFVVMILRRNPKDTEFWWLWVH